jgi:hypothetical protein
LRVARRAITITLMADRRRFDFFADLIAARFPEKKRVYDVAGGMGRLQVALAARGCAVTTFDVRHKRLPNLRYAERIFTIDEPPDCDLVVGLHADGATRVIVEYAARHSVPFAIVPCCSDNGMPYKPWMRHLAALAVERGLRVSEATLPMPGRARVIVGEP